MPAPDGWDTQRAPDFRSRLFLFGLPIFVIGMHIAILFLFLPYEQFLVLMGITVAYILPPAGKETAIPVGIALGLPWWLPAIAISLVDCELGLFMVLNYDLIEKIPLFGRWIATLRVKAGEFVGKHPWFSRAAFSGIVILVMSPVLGSGGIRGSIIGRMLGLSKGAVLLAIAIGAFAGSFGIALGFRYVWSALGTDTPLKAAVLGVVVAAAIAGYLIYRYKKKKSS
ncbi:MAG: small multi-drug export protein [Methanoregulaceae archaeon]|nr:small multi-drug export protein [Methanoregulaceae archaeon]